MNLESKCYIVALFIRDDGERLRLGDGVYEFVEKQLHFAADKISNTTVDVQGGNGVLLAGQVRRANTQTFKGYVGDSGMSKAEIQTARREFINFFKEQHYFEVVYVMPDGSAVKRQRGFLVNAPEVKDLWQIFPEYSVGLSFEDVNYYRYNEDEEGNELYGEEALLPLYNAPTGGYEWDEDGLMFDELGAISLPGVGGTAEINIGSKDYVYPIWTVKGLAVNPSLENLTTGQKITYNGRVAPGQVLEIDMLNGAATLGGVNVLNRVSGDWLSFIPGINRVNFKADNDNTGESTIKWAEIVE